MNADQRSFKATPSTSFRGFVREVMFFVNKWDGRSRPTRAELERIAQWWHECPDCCPEAIALEVRQVYPAANYLRQLVSGAA